LTQHSKKWHVIFKISLSGIVHVKSTALFATIGMFMAGSASAVTVNYQDLGTFTTPTLIEGGITVTGSADVSVRSFTGLGISDASVQDGGRGLLAVRGIGDRSILSDPDPG
jgi:hypothetical protein